MKRIKRIITIFLVIVFSAIISNLSHKVPICEGCSQKIIVSGIPFPDTRIIKLNNIEDSVTSSFIYWILLICFAFNIWAKRINTYITIADLLGWILMPVYFFIGIYEFFNPYIIDHIPINTYGRITVVVLIFLVLILSQIVKKISKKKIIFTDKDYYDVSFTIAIIFVSILIMIGVI